MVLFQIAPCKLSLKETNAVTYMHADSKVATTHIHPPLPTPPGSVLESDVDVPLLARFMGYITTSYVHTCHLVQVVCRLPHSIC